MTTIECMDYGYGVDEKSGFYILCITTGVYVNDICIYNTFRTRIPYRYTFRSAGEWLIRNLHGHAEDCNAFNIPENSTFAEYEIHEVDRNDTVINKFSVEFKEDTNTLIISKMK